MVRRRLEARHAAQPATGASMALTGRAAEHMTEASGFEAKTSKGGGFKRSDDAPLDCDPP